MYKGLYDKDTKALEKRIKINENSKFDFDQWIIQNLKIEDGINILDLGCGTGKQIKAIREQFSVRITGVDICSDGLNFYDKNTNLICADFDDNVIFGKFDRIVSTYAIYYSQNINKTIQRYMSMLSEDGFIFLVGFGKKTNEEFYKFVNQIIKEKNINVEPRIANDFMTNVPSFAEVLRLENKVYFESKKQMMQWWTNHNSYIKEIHDEVFEILPETLEMSKNTMGVILRNSK